MSSLENVTYPVCEDHVLGWEDGRSVEGALIFMCLYVCLCVVYVFVCVCRVCEDGKLCDLAIPIASA